MFGNLFYEAHRYGYFIGERLHNLLMASPDNKSEVANDALSAPAQGRNRLSTPVAVTALALAAASFGYFAGHSRTPPAPNEKDGDSSSLVVSELVAPQSNAISPQPRSLATNVVIISKDPIIKATVEEALTFIDSHPACLEAKMYFSDSRRARAIVVESLPSKKDGELLIGSYNSNVKHFLTLNSDQISERIARCRAFQFTEKESRTLVALSLVETICHEASHATHDEHLDSEAKAALGFKFDVKPLFFEDEVLCRIKAVRADKEMQRIAQTAMPEQFALSRLDIFEDAKYLKQDASVIASIRNEVTSIEAYNSLVSIDVEPGRKQFTFGSLSSQLSEFYRDRISAAALQLKENESEDLAASSKLAIEIILRNEYTTDKSLQNALLELHSIQSLLPKHLQVDEETRSLLRRKASHSLVEQGSAAWIEAYFESDPSKQIAALASIYNFMEANPTQQEWSFSRLSDTAARLGVIVQLGAVLGPKEEAKILSNPSAMESDSPYRWQWLNYFASNCASLKYTPRNRDLFIATAKAAFEEGSFPCMDQSRVSWSISAARTLGCEDEVKSILKTSVDAILNDPRAAQTAISFFWPNIIAVQNEVGLDRQKIITHIQATLDEQLKDDSPMMFFSVLKEISVQFPELLPEAAAKFRAAPESWRNALNGLFVKRLNQLEADVSKTK